MKKRLTIILTAFIIIIGVTASKLPAFANSNIEINSTGSLTLEGSDVSFDAEDIKDIQTQVNALSDELPEGTYASSKEGTLKNNLNSKGIINYDSGKVIFDSSDLIKLANGIDNLKTCFQSKVVECLKSIHTYYKADGTVTHVESEAISSEVASNLTFGQICNGILKSQSLEHLAGENILPATADNLSEGSAAWVDGDIVIGTGNDNKVNYEQGYEKGYEDGENSGGKCYYLGDITTTVNGLLCCDVKELVPELDYTKLTINNFIICPSIINENTVASAKYLSIADNVTSYCSIPEQKLELIGHFYDEQTGRLFFWPLTIYANGGLSSKSGFTRKAETEVTVSIYIYTGDIIEP